MIAIAAGLIQIVEYRHYGFPLPFEFNHQAHQFNLMIDIEVGRRLIKKNEWGILCQHHRQKRTLALAAGKLG